MLLVISANVEISLIEISNIRGNCKTFLNCCNIAWHAFQNKYKKNVSWNKILKYKNDKQLTTKPLIQNHPSHGVT